MIGKEMLKRLSSWTLSLGTFIEINEINFQDLKAEMFLILYL